MVTIKDLELFADGWNRHDVDFLITYMTDHRMFETTWKKGINSWSLAEIHLTSSV